MRNVGNTGWDLDVLPPFQEEWEEKYNKYKEGWEEFVLEDEPAGTTKGTALVSLVRDKIKSWESESTFEIPEVSCDVF